MLEMTPLLINKSLPKHDSLIPCPSPEGRRVDTASPSGTNSPGANLVAEGAVRGQAG